MTGVTGEKRTKQKFRPYLIGFFHIDISELRTEKGKLFLFVAIDRVSKFVVVKLFEGANTENAKTILEHLIAAVPYKIHTILTDNGIQYPTCQRTEMVPPLYFVVILLTLLFNLV